MICCLMLLDDLFYIYIYWYLSLAGGGELFKDEHESSCWIMMFFDGAIDQICPEWSLS